MDRKLLYYTYVCPVEYLRTDQLLQGSVLGPLLWNVMYGYGYANYVIWARETSVKLIRNWLVSHGLELAEYKTEAGLVSSRKLEEILRFHVG